LDRNKVEARLAEEQKRVHTYLHPSSEPELIQKVERVLIEKPVETLWNEFQGLLQDDKTEGLSNADVLSSLWRADLSRMYFLLQRIPRGLDPLRSIMEKVLPALFFFVSLTLCLQHVQTVGEQAVQAVAKTALLDPKQYVETILGVYRKYIELVAGPFKNEGGFVASLDKACRRFVNDNAVCKMANAASKSPELLARFCDSMPCCSGFISALSRSAQAS
jgi:cullin 1